LHFNGKISWLSEIACLIPVAKLKIKDPEDSYMDLVNYCSRRLGTQENFML